jgi:hypothetical protein
MLLELTNILTGPISALLERVVPDKNERDRMAHEIATMAEVQAQERALAQVELNKQEAAHKSLFVAGWRPFVGWVCGAAMAFNYIGVPIAGVFGAILPVLDITTMFPILIGMLGMGGLRTTEKLNKVSREK